MTKHTPASWICEGSTQNGDFAIYNEKTFEEVLDIHTGTIHEKNLHLILAAPDMLEALIDVLSDYERFMSLCDSTELKVRAAIAKATGD